MRLVLLDEVVLKQKRVLLTVNHHIFDIRYVSYQLPRLAALVVFVEIAVNPPMQVLGLADIDNLPVLVKVLVHTRLLVYAFQQ